MAPIPPLSTLLADRGVGLRFTAERDIPEMLIAHQDDEQLHVWLGQERPPSGAELGRDLEQAGRERAEGIRARLAIVEPPADDCRGEITIHAIDWHQCRASLCIWIAPKARCRGLARGALRLAGRWTFDAWGLERLAVLTDPENEAMVRAARAAGFVYEGVLRSYGHERGRRLDLAVLSLLPSDLVTPQTAVSANENPG